MSKQNDVIVGFNYCSGNADSEVVDRTGVGAAIFDGGVER